MAKNITATVRMFQVGELGDCFFLRFTDGDHQSNVLIDCGSFRNSGKSIDRLRIIVNQIKTLLKGEKLDVVVGTHQHNDHLSGFVHCETLFTGIVDQVWLSWLDNPKDGLARNISKDHKGLVSQLQAMHQKLSSVTPLKKALNDGIVEDVLGFYAAAGGDPEIPAKGVEVLKKLGDKEVAYLTPGQQLDLPGLAPGSVKVYVLGPPRDQNLLFDKDPKKGESYDKNLAIANLSAARFLSALDNYSSADNREEEQFPFNKSFQLAKNAEAETLRLYNESRNNWRKIELEWLDQASRLALYLDSYTNNSSLVLAFELVKSKKVLLFAADAQTGNWLSWLDIKWKDVEAGFSSKSLLQNTVLYKVGHHGSHNATLVEGLESMEHEELVAMISVDKSDPNITKENGWKMPAANLYKRLKEKTQFRVLRMDDGFADGCDPVKNKGKSKWDKLPNKPNVDKKNFFIEYTVKG
jgi:beta-lactamase superfamily II metal-dependent hydrolase